MDLSLPLSKYFTWKEALLLPQWGVIHIPTEEEKKNIIEFANTLDSVREFIGLPFHVHCWIRPIKANCPDSRYDGQNYNKFVGSVALNSAHIPGKALDFHVDNFGGVNGCHEIREKLLPKLEEFELRMEDLEGMWIHLDNAPVTKNRFFKP